MEKEELLLFNLGIVEKDGTITFAVNELLKGLSQYATEVKREMLENRPKIERVWAMPNAWTFTIKPIKKLLNEEVTGGNWCDPFCGKNSPAYTTNDINPEIDASCHDDALVFLKKQWSEYFDGVLLDPPYSNRQVSEHYKKAGIKVTGWHTSSGWTKAIKDEVARITKVGGKVICFGWNSMGMGKKRGFRMDRILLVPHGGGKNDTIVTVETKLTELTNILEEK